MLQLRWDHADLSQYYNDTVLHLQRVLDELIAFEHMADRSSSDAILVVGNLHERVVNALNICARLHVPFLCRQAFYKLWGPRSWTYLKIILLIYIKYG